MRNFKQQILAILRDSSANPFIGSVTFAKYLNVFRRVGADRVIEDAYASVSSLEVVVEAAAIVLHRDAAIKCIRQLIDVFAFVDVHYAQFSLVLTSPANAVHNQLAVVRCVEQADVRCVIGAERVRINEDFVLAV